MVFSSTQTKSSFVIPLAQQEQSDNNCARYRRRSCVHHRHLQLLPMLPSHKRCFRSSFSPFIVSVVLATVEATPNVIKTCCCPFYSSSLSSTAFAVLRREQFFTFSSLATSITRGIGMGTAGNGGGDDDGVRSRIANAKSLVRPNWTEERWSKHQFSSKPWPSRRNDALTLDLVETVSMVDFTKPHRIVHHNQGRERKLLGHWPDPSAFSIDRLLVNFGDQEFAVGYDEVNDDDITLSLFDYISYVSQDCYGDDSPLYIFDDWILTEEAQNPLRLAYNTPLCFPHDYLREWPGGNEWRPPYCWLLIGGARSGTALHVDPTATSAWNTLVSGKKRWFLFPPQTQENSGGGIGERGRDFGTLDYSLGYDCNDGDEGEEVASDSAIHWLYLRHCRSSAVNRTYYDFIQNPGETVYVPNGWRHAVVNLELSIAVTHNFVGPHNIGDAIVDLRLKDPVMADQWKNLLKRKGALLSDN